MVYPAARKTGMGKAQMAESYFSVWGGCDAMRADLPERTVFFKKTGLRYSVSNYFWPHVALVFTCVMAWFINENVVLAGMAIWLFDLFGICRVTLDAGNKCIEVCRAYGLWTRRIPLDAFARVKTVSLSANGPLTPTIAFTTIILAFNDGTKPVPLTTVYLTRNLEPIIRETEEIVSTATEEKIPVAVTCEPTLSFTGLGD